MTERVILLNPGPVTLSDRVRAALTEGDWCHREPEYAALTRANNAALAQVYPDMAADFDAVTLTGSGTSAVEAMLASFAPDDRDTLVLTNGVYGERMAAMLRAHGKPHRVIERDWQAPLDADELQTELNANSNISCVATVHHETTTGRLNDLHTIGAMCKSHGRQLLLDAVSSFGAEQIDAAAWNLAAVAATANKCLHGVPGLSFVLARKKLWNITPPDRGSVYLDLHAYHRGQYADGFSPFTQAVQVAFALREALAELDEAGGWQARGDLYRARAQRIHATLDELGIGTLLPPTAYSSVLWTYQLPEGDTYARVHGALKDAGFVIYAGQGALSPQVFRIAHMGDIRDDDLDRLCSALRNVFGAAR
ncbi:MAG: aminotransferase class V-fold PLP-dependent enzyme [Gammaproteobacteria bacterium]|nr:aminotransferase class V-fold PLP-dependent enzyme [Gammaproteobacteria bacterium]